MAKRPRPGALPGVTYRKETPLGTAYITVNVNGGNQPFEVFMNVGKAGSDVAAVSEALGRLISLLLRLPSQLSPGERLESIIEQLAGIGGGRSMGFGANRVRSLPDAVAQVLQEHLSRDISFDSEEGEEEDEPRGVPADQLPLPMGDRIIGDLCPDWWVGCLLSCCRGLPEVYGRWHSECRAREGSGTWG
jgi:ribonucleoside-diphosphate reductase alpha chain